jgi:three-Cys-motif partner protein
MPILSRQSQKVGQKQDKITYIDGFAGPGVYEKGEKGSPVLALEAALDHSHEFPVPVELIFIENDPDRCRVLEAELGKYAHRLGTSRNVRLKPPICGDCRTILSNILSECDSKNEKFGPALVFLDQFGYSSVPMDLIERILAHPQCEVLSFLFWREIDRFITDTTKHESINVAFGCGDWKPAISMPGRERDHFMLATYMRCLRERARARFVWQFAMQDRNERLLCWLFFSTNHIRGLEEMKKAMWKIDKTGGFAFSDKEGFGQLKFLTAYSDTQLGDDLARSLGGKRLKVAEVKEWVLTQTPAYKFKAALADLEKRGLLKVINAPHKRKAGQFPDESLLLEFSLPPLFPP